MRKVILYYKYINIKEPLLLKDSEIRICEKLNLKGRIIISKEGINGTLSGDKKDIEEYKKNLLSQEQFKDIVFKESFSRIDVFPKLLVKIRDEIVSLKQNIDINGKDKRGEYISPEDFHSIIEREDENVIILDARNSYESYIGKFKGAITPDIDNFRDFPKVIDILKKYKNKKIVMYCTGGVRCEKASSLLRNNGFKDVSQLKDGILNYANSYPSDFEGKCYVFDRRIAVEIDPLSKIISVCKHCKIPSDRYINCIYKKCNIQFICCESCDIENQHSCSQNCYSSVFINHFPN